MTWWQAAILGLVQGLTEFLPVSSSGHLVLGQYLLGLDSAMADDVTFEVFVHFGTTLSILVVYRERIASIIRSVFKTIAKPSKFMWRYERSDNLRTAIFILISMIPTGLVYVLFKDRLEAAFGDPRTVCMMLIFTGVLLLLTLLRRNPDGENTLLKSILIGIAQAAAMTPGISRSGSTICTAIYMNVDREEAANFSFLMVLPVILGATLLKTLEMLEVGVSRDILPILLGTVVAFVSGIAAIKLVLNFVRRGGLQYFAIYLFIAGGLGLIFIQS